MKKRVAVGVSGGVDSSVAALRLKQEGYDVVGIFMKNWEDDDGCTAENDYADVASVCNKIGIPYYTVNFSEEYYERVFEIFLTQYQKGRTPNPDVLCNSEIKFKAFLDYALTVVKADFIATGHYARKAEYNGKAALLRGLDESKDQTYFLCGLNQYQLSKALFPIGEMKKSAVRQIASEYALRTADKKDSTGICFIGEKKFRDFLANYLPNQPGLIRSVDGQVVGEHLGLMYYTLGQRRGLGIGGTGNGGRWYVAAKDLDQNELIVVQDAVHPLLFSQAFYATNVNFISGSPPAKAFECTLKYRHLQPDRKAKVAVQDDGNLYVEFFEPQRAVCPGQYAVFYDGAVCLGGAEIDKTVGV